MAEASHQNEDTVSSRTMELVVAGVLMALSALIMWDNSRTGAWWGDDGPQAGYFPFRVGAILFFVSAATFVTQLMARKTASPTFVERSALRQVLQVLVPTVVFVASIGFLGIYVAAALFITFFMWWLGKYPVLKILPIAIIVPIVLFFMFEVWFLVPLPKGPIETWLGY